MLTILKIAAQVFLLVVALFFSGATLAAGLLTPTDAALPALEIRDHQVDVVIEDGYAITTVEQVFTNPHDRDLEAHYTFPIPEQGSVVEFTLWIDGKQVTGEVVEREAARWLYTKEKAAGRDAGILEKDDHRTFEIRIAPVLAGQNTRIRLAYIQPVDIDTGIGRYVYPLEEGGVDDQPLSSWAANEQVNRQFRFDLRIKSAYPLDAVQMPNQPRAVVQQLGAGEWLVHLGQWAAGEAAALDLSEALPPSDPPSSASTNPAAFTLNQDLVVYWRHQAGLPGSVDLVAHKPDGATRGTFLMVVTPGDDLQPIQEGRDWVFVLDTSGSMKGKFPTLVEGIERALDKMRPTDRFRIVLFNEEARELTTGFETATPEAVAHYRRALADITPKKGTNLYAGLQQGLQSLDAERTSAVVLVTDGVANVREIRQRRFLELMNKQDVRLFTFVLGNSANRPLLEALTQATGGFAMNLSNSDDIGGQLLAATDKVTHEALHGIEIEIEGVETADIAPSQIGSLYRGQQLVLFGHYWGEGLAEVRLSGQISGQAREYRTQFAFPAQATENPEIERLWAYAQIKERMWEIHHFGERADRKQAVIELGVGYGLVTDYTAMVVVREAVFEAHRVNRCNRARLAAEQAAQEQRALRPAVSRWVDHQQPMFSSSRASRSGGGAMDAWTLALLLPLVWFALRHRQSRVTH